MPTTPQATHGATVERGITGDATRSEANGHGATLGPAGAAKALGVRRETVYRWMNEGKLAFVMEESSEGGPPRKRVPISAIEQHLAEKGRGPQATAKATQSATVERGATDGDHNAPFVERLLLVAETASTLRAQLEASRRMVEAAVERLDSEPAAPWWRRRKERREREAAAATALRQLAALPPPPDSPL